MLNQMIESRANSGDGARRGRFFFSTLVSVALLCGGGMVWSLFAKDLGVGNENLELSRLVSPVVIAETAPPVPEPVEKQSAANQTEKTESVLPTRTANIARTDETKYIPEKVSVMPSAQKARPAGMFTIGTKDSEGISAQTPTAGREPGNNNVGIAQAMKPELVKTNETGEPPAIKKTVSAAEKPVPAEPRKPVTQSLGVINGKALNLPVPAYPAAAQAVRASGEVNVQVSIDEDGRVISAKAVSGHPLLRSVSENAAKNAKFSQTFLSRQPVKVTGIIIYKFAPR